MVTLHKAEEEQMEGKKAARDLVYVLRFGVLVLSNVVRVGFALWYVKLGPEAIERNAIAGACLWAGVMWTFIDIGLIAMFRRIIKELE